ncbi:hypothetical protein [Sulfitobacter guttiformis]|uniref:Uncharacterized protein n=1 Tax=Sulfitobacter guttiformis TaxID=74349 RepID=A0A420DRL6_9RHOB|nr:hypothetical protein [Sulfitobacter guttiformis]KIN74163.1 hypothetical protein Z949_3359 [Sulfitobacter guttiformis KCTC 32187]RKE96777.1 hypothetical protein C8N30_1347 [Sulfitobacter guttiformis]
MLAAFIDSARREAKHTAGTAAISFGAGILLCIGLAFWTAAGWMLLLTVTSPINAAMIMGAIFTGAALIGFAVVSVRGSNHKKRPAHAAPKPPTLDGLIAAFISGLTAGARTRSR